MTTAPPPARIDLPARLRRPLAALVVAVTTLIVVGHGCHGDARGNRAFGLLRYIRMRFRNDIDSLEALLDRVFPFEAIFLPLFLVTVGMLN